MNVLVQLRAAVQFVKDAVHNVFCKEQLILISEGFDWVIHDECLAIKSYLETHALGTVRVSTTPLGLRNKIVHFLSENTLIGPKGLRFHHGSNRFILTWFHISAADTFRVRYIPLLNQEISYLHTAASITERKLVQYGMDPQKVVRVGLDVNLDVFHPIAPSEKKVLRNTLGLPQQKILIGSFQKDGVGWGEGSEPKHIKGPDIFCSVVEALAHRYPLHIILTGPARGYVKERLTAAGISYTHVYLKHSADVAQYYQVLDLYLICAREEGGPKALLEALASGTPLVSTAVGMAPDVIENGVQGILVPVEDTAALIRGARTILDNPRLRDAFITAGRAKVQEYSTAVMVKKMHASMYSSLMIP